MTRWLAGYGRLERVGVEGTGAYGAALARHLQGQGVLVVEVDRPDSKARRARARATRWTPTPLLGPRCPALLTASRSSATGVSRRSGPYGLRGAVPSKPVRRR